MIWIPDSNRGISVYKTDAVATEPIQNIAHRVRIELTTSGFGVRIATIGIPMCMCSMSGSNRLFPWLEARRTTPYAYAACVLAVGIKPAIRQPAECKPAAAFTELREYIAEAGIEPGNEAYETS